MFLIFDIVINSIVVEKGNKSVFIFIIGYDKDRFIVMLVCFGDGMKFLLYVVFKCKILLKNMVFFYGFVVRC